MVLCTQRPIFLIVKLRFIGEFSDLIERVVFSSEYYKQKKEENKQAKESKKRKAETPTGREKYTNEVRKGLVMIVTGLGEKTDRDELKVR